MSSPATRRTAEIRPNRGGQFDFLADVEHLYVALEGGWGAGKSWAGARKLLVNHLCNASGGHVRSAVVAPTYLAAVDFCIPAIIDGAAEIGVGAAWRSTLKEIQFPGTRLAPIMVRTADRPDRITGWEVGAFWGDEAARWKEDRSDPRNDPLIQLKGRLRHPRAIRLQGVYTYTNEGDHTRIFEEFHSATDRHALYRAGTASNPLMTEFAATLLGQLTPELARQYVGGEAISLRGAAVYSPFSDGLNVDASLEPVAGIPLTATYDFNIAPGMHVYLGQWLGEERGFVTFEEIHGPSMNAIQATKLAAAWVRAAGGIQRFGGTIEVFGDASGSARSAATGESDYQVVGQTLQSEGLPFRLRVPKANPHVRDRINAMNMALSDARGKVRWRCRPACRRLIADLARMRYDKHGEPDKSNPDLSHASDAEGYRVHFLRPVRVERPYTPGRWSV